MPMSNLSASAFGSVSRSNRRNSGTGQGSDGLLNSGEGSHAPSHLTSGHHGGPGNPASNVSSEFVTSALCGDPPGHHATSTSVAARRSFLRRPWFANQSQEDFRSRHSSFGGSQGDVRQQSLVNVLPAPSTASVPGEMTHIPSHGADGASRSPNPERLEGSSMLNVQFIDIPRNPAGGSASLRSEIGDAMASSLPADDGMQLLRKRIHEIREMNSSSEEKARRMHTIMTEKYIASRAQMIRPQSPSSIISQDRPVTPTSSQSHSEWETHLTSPVSLYSAYDPENPFNIQSDDLMPTYRVKEPEQSTSETALPYGEEDEEEDDQSLGCKHYKRNVKIQCFDCRRWYSCRHCHNEAEEHALNRRKTKNMLCMLCQTPQAAAEYCRHCGQSAAWYYCDICKLWDDDNGNKIYHCEDCGICRKGEGLGKDYFHCKKCNVCISIKFAEDHRCLEGATERDCPICGEYLQTSTTPAAAMPCGHYLHRQCYDDYMHTAYKCPICKKSAINMELHWRKLTHDIESQPMPPPFAETRVFIQCNDCSTKSSVKYHFLGHKCSTCDSYNTDELHFMNQPDLTQIIHATEQIESAQPTAQSLNMSPGRQMYEPARVAQLRSGGSYFHADREILDDSLRPSTAALAFEHLRLSPQDILERFSRSLSPIRHYLNGSSDDDPKAQRSRVSITASNEDQSVDFWGSDGRFLSGEEDAGEELEVEESDESADELECGDDEGDDDGDEEPDRIELIGHR